MNYQPNVTIFIFMNISLLSRHLHSKLGNQIDLLIRISWLSNLHPYSYLFYLVTVRVLSNVQWWVHTLVCLYVSTVTLYGRFCLIFQHKGDHCVCLSGLSSGIEHACDSVLVTMQVKWVRRRALTSWWNGFSKYLKCSWGLYLLFRK